MQSLERNKVKHDLDMAIVSQNKRNAELEEENETLKTNLRNKETTIVDLTSETKIVLSEKKTLEDKYLEEIVCLKNANKVATGILQKFQMPTQTIPMLSKQPLSESYDLHKTSLGCTNPWYNKQARSTQPALYDGHVLLNPAHQPTRVHDSEETNAQAEASRAKMSQKPGHVTPANYAKLNALYDQFVSQKELSREQVYWFSATDIASQPSDPPKPATPFVHTRPVNSEVHKKVWKIKECLTAFEQTIEQRTKPPSYLQGTYEFNYLKKCFDAEIIPFYENLKQLFDMLDHNIYMKVKEFERL